MTMLAHRRIVGLVYRPCVTEVVYGGVFRVVFTGWIYS